MRKKLRLPSPAMVVAMIALLVALGGTAAAAKIVAHARLADNALKLQGKTAARVPVPAWRCPACGRSRDASSRRARPSSRCGRSAGFFQGPSGWRPASTRRRGLTASSRPWGSLSSKWAP